VSALLVIAGVVAAVMVVNSVLPAISGSSNSIAQASAKVSDRIETQVSIVYATGELDTTGTWQDTNSDSDFDITVWVKNVGNARILDVGQMDVFLGRSGTFARIPYVDDAGASYPRWVYALENGDEWENSVTAKITIHYSSTQASDTYMVKVITPSGAYDEHYFSF